MIPTREWKLLERASGIRYPPEPAQNETEEVLL